MLAELYLEHRNDKRMYAACHEEMAAKHPTVSSYVMLGEAYMRIQDPESAIAAFEQALHRSPNDAALASRIGQVRGAAPCPPLVTTPCPPLVTTPWPPLVTPLGARHVSGARQDARVRQGD